jgi:hypothetical protein
MCFCFTVLPCESIFCVLCCQMFIEIFHIQMPLMQRLDQWNEYICMDTCFLSMLNYCGVILYAVSIHVSFICRGCMYVCMYACMCVGRYVCV